MELAGAYRDLASGILAEPHVIDHVTDAAGALPIFRDIMLRVDKDRLVGRVRAVPGSQSGHSTS